MRRSGPLLCPFLGGIGRRLRRIKLHHRNADLYQWLTSLFVEWYYSCYVLCHSYFVKWAGRSVRSGSRSQACRFSCASLAGNVLGGTVPIFMNGGIW